MMSETQDAILLCCWDCIIKDSGVQEQESGDYSSVVCGSFINSSRKLSEFPSVVCVPLGALVPLVLYFTVHMDLLKSFNFLVEHLMHLTLRPE